MLLELLCKCIYITYIFFFKDLILKYIFILVFIINLILLTFTVDVGKDEGNQTTKETDEEICQFVFFTGTLMSFQLYIFFKKKNFLCFSKSTYNI